jgi:hypothetical protein
MHDRVQQIADQPPNRHITARGFVAKTHNEPAANLLTRDEARRIAANIAKLSKLPSRRAGAVMI